MRKFQSIENEERREYEYRGDIDHTLIIDHPVAIHVKDDGTHVIMSQDQDGNYGQTEVENGWDRVKIVTTGEEVTSVERDEDLKRKLLEWITSQQGSGDQDATDIIGDPVPNPTYPGPPYTNPYTHEYFLDDEQGENPYYGNRSPDTGTTVACDDPASCPQCSEECNHPECDCDYVCIVTGNAAPTDENNSNPGGDGGQGRPPKGSAPTW